MSSLAHEFTRLLGIATAEATANAGADGRPTAEQITAAQTAVTAVETALDAL